jgi:hypothetical protein
MYDYRKYATKTLGLNVFPGQDNNNYQELASFTYGNTPLQGEKGTRWGEKMVD